MGTRDKIAETSKQSNAFGGSMCLQIGVEYLTLATRPKSSGQNLLVFELFELVTEKSLWRADSWTKRFHHDVLPSLLKEMIHKSHNDKFLILQS